MAHTLISWGADINQVLISTSKVVENKGICKVANRSRKLRGEIEGYEAVQKRIISPKQEELAKLNGKI